MSLKLAYDADEQQRSFSEWIVMELAPTIYGHKPATILTLKDTKHMPSYSLWKKFGEYVLAGSVIRHKVLKETDHGMIMLFYHPHSLQKWIFARAHRDFLEQRGYQVERGLEDCLELLRERFQQTCPHEIGLLLGIPLKDVLGFMGLNKLSLTCRGLWCIYGEPACSIKLMKCFMEDRKRISELLKQGHPPQKLLCG